MTNEEIGKAVCGWLQAIFWLLAAIVILLMAESLDVTLARWEDRNTPATHSNTVLDSQPAESYTN
jgi:hypothetical protein